MYKLEYPQLEKYQSIFLQHLREDEKLNEKTILLHKRIVVYFLNFIGEMNKNKLLEITEQDVIDFIGSLKTLNDTTKSASCYTIRKFLDYHHKNNNVCFSGHKVFPYIHRNYDNHLISFYNSDELTSVLNSFDLSNKHELRDYVIVLLIMETGMRESDVANLKVNSINWDQKCIDFIQIKTGKPNRITISDNLMYLLIEYLKNRIPVMKDNDFIFYNHDGKRPVQSTLVYSIVKKYLIRSGIDFHGRRKGPHAIRSSLATNMLKNNTPVPVIQSVLGHEKIKTTLGYIRVDLKMLEKVALEVPIYEEKNDIVFENIFKDIALDYINFKRTLGFKVGIVDQRNLNILLKFLFEENPDNPLEFTYDTVMKFCFQNKDIKAITIAHKQSLIRQFAIYINEIKGINCYIFNEDLIKTEKDYFPHIYSVDEINKIIETIDNMKYTEISIKRQIPQKISAVIRLIYGCGLRINEAASLKRVDVNLIEGSVTLSNTKNNKTRYIPLSKSVKESLINYDKILLRDYDNPYFFPQDDGYFSTESIRKIFKNAVVIAGIDGKDSNGKIRVHCLRHTYCVHAMEKLINEGMDPYCTLPIISAYMGHSSLKSSEYYMRLTKHYFLEVLNYSKDDAEKLFPEVKGYE